MDTIVNKDNSVTLVGYVRRMLKDRYYAFREISADGNHVFVYDGMRHVVDIAFDDTTQTFEAKQLNGEVILRGDYATALTSIAAYLKSIGALSSEWEV